MQALDAALKDIEPKAFAAALDGQIRQRFDRLAAGIEAYRRHPYRRALAEPPVLWQDGTTRLLDYRAAGSDGPMVLVIPSLINRAYILDLLPERSLLRALAASGVRPLLVDWGAPGDLERGFSLTDYIAGRLEQALDAAVQRAGGPVAALGYCMGGLLAVALAARRRPSLSGLVCLATPWDFHAERPAQAKLIGTAATLLDPMLRQIGELPVDAIQALFTGIDPLQVVRKFVAFADMDATSPRADSFVAVEDWLNDGVPLAAPVARECLAGWYGANTPGRGEWRVAGEVIQPAALDLPALVVLPDQDRIVPPASAEALAAALPRAERLQPAAGHIGMIVGGGAVEQLYRPLAHWLARRR
jgi:polyhydroxyalkanoate synthase